MSDWEGFELEDFPNIIDKQIPGCGFTHWCLTNEKDIILCSPRKVLLENKKEQLGDDVFLVKSFYLELGVDKDTSSKRLSPVDPKKVKEKLAVQVEKAKKNFELIKNDLVNFWLMCQAQKKPCKILVTYDSFLKVKEVLQKELGVFDSFHTVVDEFQSIFIDSRFKSDTELEFMNSLQDVQKVCYVSATPMIEKYLDELDEFKHLPYTILDWKTEDPGRVSRPALSTYILKSVKGVGEKIISSYKSGKFERSAVNINGVSKIVESKEAVIYVNSVNNIINLIYWNNLEPEECNILCADTEENQKRIKQKLGKRFEIGRVPTKGEPRKMFTFCTRTVYLGADFYSDNARSFILSDANVDSMAVDITLDLPQILGRQRLKENPWKNKADLYVKIVAKKNKKALKEFENLIAKKNKTTDTLLEIYEETKKESKHALAENYEVVAMTLKYKKDYVAVNERAGKDLVPCRNNLACISERRAFEIQQLDYADRFTVFSKIDEVFGKDEGDENNISQEVASFMQLYDSLSEAAERLKVLCTADLSEAALASVLDLVSEYHKRFYVYLGPERCRALGYNYARLEKDCQIKNFSKEQVEEFIYSKFHEGDKITLQDAKEMLKEGYKALGYERSPKATDLGEWFEIQECSIYPDGKKLRAIKLLKKKG